MSNRVLLVAVALAACWAAGAIADPPAPPEVAPILAIGTQSIRVSGITPGGEVVWFGMGRDVDADEVPVITHVGERMADDDKDGTVELRLDHPVPLRSTWLAVDLKTGLYDLAAPEGFAVRRATWHGRGPLVGQGASDRLEERRPYAEILLVRPGAGAWTLRLGDGGQGDADGKPDGTLRAVLDQMGPLGDGTASAPARLQKDDLVVLFDPNALEVVITRMGAANP